MEPGDHHDRDESPAQRARRTLALTVPALTGARPTPAPPAPKAPGARPPGGGCAGSAGPCVRPAAASRDLMVTVWPAAGAEDRSDMGTSAEPARAARLPPAVIRRPRTNSTTSRVSTSASAGIARRRGPCLRAGDLIATLRTGQSPGPAPWVAANTNAIPGTQSGNPRAARGRGARRPSTRPSPPQRRRYVASPARPPP